MTPQELKNSILQLALQGKLTKQEDFETVDLSLFSPQKNNKMESSDIEIPSNWCFSTLEEFCEVIPTKQYQILEKQVKPTGKYPVISQSKEYQIGFSDDQERLYKLDFPIVAFGDHTTIIKYIDFDFVVGADGIKLLKPKGAVHSKYLFYSLQLLTLGLEKVGGYSRHYKFIRNKPIPIPPLAEQKRIVAKIEELLPYIDRYEQAWNRLEAFNKRFPVDVQKSLLQLAIQGKLVEQRPEEGTAEELYRQIQKEKRRLIREGKIKKEKPLPEVAADEVPFEIPENWIWCRLGNILYKLTDGAHSTPKYTAKGVPFLSVKDMSSGQLDFSGCKYISEQEHRELYSRCNPECGDMLLTKIGTTGIPVIVNTDKQFSLFVSVALLKFDQNLIYNKFLQILINSPLVQTQAAENTRGVGNKNWVIRDIANTLIPLPPLAEQKRIVAKLEELLPLCERLK